MLEAKLPDVLGKRLQEQGPCYDTLDVIERLPPTLRSFLEPLGLWPPVV